MADDFFLEVIDVYQAVGQHFNGLTYVMDTFWATFHLAQLASNAIGGNPKPIHRKALRLQDGRAWLLEGEPVQLLKDPDDAKRQAALKKLTPEERRILGLDK
jgi:hypothetical protein